MSSFTASDKESKDDKVSLIVKVISVTKEKPVLCSGDNKSDLRSKIPSIKSPTL